MKTIFNLVLIFGLAASVAQAQAQDEVPPPMPAAPTFSDAQLQQLLGPIALYPDPLIAIMLPAATLPTEIVMADRYVSGGGDLNQIDQQPWDPNIQALAHYPDVLKWMDDNLNWTTQLGEAFQNQQPDVMTAVQELRTDAYNMGNLQSTPQQQVIDDNGYIEILPANPQDVYVPQYQPAQVYYTQAVGTPYVTFGVGFVIGPWLCGDFDWRNHHLISWDRDHPRPANWWHQRPDERANYIASGRARVWNGPERRPNAQGFQGDRGYNNNLNRDYNNNLPWTAPPANSQTKERVEQQRNQEQQRVDQQRSQQQQRIDQQQLQAQRMNQQQNQAQQRVDQQRQFQNNQPPPNNAFIGSQSAHDTRDFSNRGEHSMETMPQFHDLGGFHGGSPPPARQFNNAAPAPAPSPAPSRGGFHGGAPPSGGGSHSAPPSGGGGGGSHSSGGGGGGQRH